MKYVSVVFCAYILLSACSQTETSPQQTDNEVERASGQASSVAAKQQRDTPSLSGENREKLATILDAQPEDSHKSRYQYRHPLETFEFFEITPGKTVVEGLPGAGWYSPILAEYIGADGKVIGADYPKNLWYLIGTRYPVPALEFAFVHFSTDAFLDPRAQWPVTWPARIQGRLSEEAAEVEGFTIGELPNEMHGVADVVFAVRLLHHLARFEEVEPFFDNTIQDYYDVLKPGGILGVVQHRAPEGYPDAWAKGHAGYLKQSDVIRRITEAGFEFVAASEINANPADIPEMDPNSEAVTLENVVWRLPPALSTSEEGSELRAKVMEIGETDRMTLKFRKPE